MTRAALILLLSVAPAIAQEHRHPTEILTGATALFYETWMRPDMPTVSCCNLSDCAVVSEVRRLGNRWQARRKSDGAWLSIPPEKIEERRDSPDGQSHMCSVGVNVFCFIAGGGT
jgi:hypothetical protein